MNQPKAILFLMFSLLVANLFAQNSISSTSLEKEGMTAVYFKTSQYLLDAASQEIINDFIKDKELLEPFEFRLRGFTDDVGNRSTNKQLASSRAEEVKKYLETLGVAEERIKILEYKELILDKSQDLVEQRQKNRRVEIELWKEKNAFLSAIKLNNEELNAFFAENRKEAQQQYFFDAQKGIVLRGKQGTVIRIPANCFVDEAGNIARGKITFTMQEVYTYRDMILQNLATTSDGQQLETGGMLYLEAKDSTGSILSIREGKGISANMASENASLRGMQTFEGEGGEVVGDLSIDWKATQDTVQRRTVQAPAYSNSFPYNNSAYTKSLFSSLEGKEATLQVWNERLPFKFYKKPSFKLRQPKNPKLRIVQNSTKEVLRERYKKGKKEKKETYRKRILNKYFALKKKDRKHRHKNKELIREYKKDSTQYAAKLRNYEASKIAYKESQRRIKTVLQEMALSADSFSLNRYVSSYQSLYHFSSTVFTNYDRMNFYMSEMENQLLDLDTIGQDFLVKANNISAQILNEEDIEIDNLSLDRSNLEQVFYKKRGKEKKKVKAYAAELQQLWAIIKDKKHLTASDLRKIRSKRREIEKQYDFRSLTTIYNQKMAAIKEAQPALKNFLSIEDEFLGMKEEYDSFRVQYNLPEPEIQSTTYQVAYSRYNILKVRDMGWINCDRFIGRGMKLLARVKINIKPTDNTYVYVVFKDMKSVMPTVFSEDHFAVMSVPSNAMVQIIGLRKNEDGLELFLEEGTLKKLNGVRPAFEKKTKKELNAILAKL